MNPIKQISKGELRKEEMSTLDDIKSQIMMRKEENTSKEILEMGKWSPFKKIVLIVITLIAFAIVINFIRLSTHKQISQPTQISSNDVYLNPEIRITHNQEEPYTKRRNLSVWTSNCCPTTQKCGMFVEDCCKIDVRGCNWYFFCYQKADDKNCLRVRSIVKKLDGYWAI